MPGANYWIDRLNLEPHPEGGFYRQTYRAPLLIEQSALPKAFNGPRNAATSIYFLLQGDDFSALHRLAADELWHFHAGSTVLIHSIDFGGSHTVLKLGQNLDAGEHLQAVVPAGYWFGSCLQDPGSFALVGCTVAPGFDFADFEMGDRTSLIAEFPQHRPLIESLTRSVCAPTQ